MSWMAFEDDFVLKEAGTTEKLPDSEEYLSKLESKLKRLQSSSGVLQQLKDRREHLIATLLASDSPLEQRISDLELDQPLGSSAGSGPQILRSLINPEQPLTVGELLHLVRHDELNRDDCGEVEEEGPLLKKEESDNQHVIAASSPPSR